MAALVILYQFGTAQAEYHKCDKLSAVFVFAVPVCPEVELLFLWTALH